METIIIYISTLATCVMVSISIGIVVTTHLKDLFYVHGMLASAVLSMFASEKIADIIGAADLPNELYVIPFMLGLIGSMVSIYIEKKY